jgi:pimeloyl-ACP methyl ester carboxylesterase
LLLCGTLAAPGTAQDTTSRPDSNVAEIQKLNGLFTVKRNRNAADYAITTPNRIDESKYVMIGGIEQWISIRGEDRANPVLLFLHGGPGDATNPWAYAVFRPWLRKFTVVQWDQRGAGRTLGKNGRSLGPTITVDRMVSDGIELSELLRKTLKQDKLIVLGHSWGTRIGVLMAKARPDLFYAYVGTGQLGADPAKTDSASYAALLKKAESIGDQRAIRELEEVGRPPWKDGRGFAVQHRWSNLFEHADVFLPSTLALALSAPGYSLSDVNDWIEGQILSAQRLVPQERAIGIDSLGGEFRVPVFVIQGAEDFTTPTSLAWDFERSIHAPRKAFVTIEGGGHFAVFMKSDAFLAALVRLVYPLAKRP